MIPTTRKKEDYETTQARALLADPQVLLAGAVVTADPLHNKQDTLRIIVEKGGDYVVGTKDNTSKRLEGAVAALKDTSFLTKVAKPGMAGSTPAEPPSPLSARRQQHCPSPAAQRRSNELG
jgi:hypothetical protein